MRENVIPASATTTSFVGYVWTDELNKDRKSGCSDRPNKADWDSSLVADVLEVRKSLDIEAQCTQPLWVNIWVPQDIPSGVYKGALTVSGENFADVRLPMKINVQKEHCPTLLNGFFILTYGRTRMLWHAIIMFLCGAGSISIL